MSQLDALTGYLLAGALTPGQEADRSAPTDIPTTTREQPEAPGDAVVVSRLHVRREQNGPRRHLVPDPPRLGHRAARPQRPREARVSRGKQLPRAGSGSIRTVDWKG
jgi:hypothetical protein